MEQVYLRALEIGDLERTYKWHNDPNMYSIMGGTFRFVSHASEEAWIRKKQEFSTTDVSLAICVTETSQHIGNIYLRNIDWVNRHAELQMWIGEQDKRSQGYGFAAQTLLHNHAFNDLGLLRLYLYILEGNPSTYLAKKFGFVKEGKLRQQVFKDGEFKDIVIMGLCVDDIQ